MTSLTTWLGDVQFDADARELFLMSPDLLAVLHDDGKIRRFNPAWSAALGYSESDLIKHPLSSFIAGDTLDADRLVHLTDTNEKLQLHLKASDGSALRAGLIAARRREFEHESFVYLILRPVTDQEEICATCGRVLQAEAIADAMRKRLRAVVEQAPFPMLFLDAEGHIRYINHKGWHDYLGYDSADDVVGQNLWSMANPEQVKLRMALYRKAQEEPGQAVGDGKMQFRNRWDEWIEVRVTMLSLLNDPNVGMAVFYWGEVHPDER